MHRLIVRQVKGAERFVVSLCNGRSAEDGATLALPVGWAVRAGSERKLNGESMDIRNAARTALSNTPIRIRLR
jgi:hypothetical protein